MLIGILIILKTLLSLGGVRPKGVRDNLTEVQTVLQDWRSITFGEIAQKKYCWPNWWEFKKFNMKGG